MAGWIDRAEQLTYDGEEIAETLAVGEGGVVVTTHRLLVFSPESDGEAFSHVDLPNVDGIDTVEAGERRFLELGAKAGIVGTVLLLSGALIPLDELVGAVSFGEGAGRIGIGGVVNVIQSILGILRALDDLLLVLGALAFLLAAGALGWYLQTREEQLRIERAGGESLTLTIGAESLSPPALDRLRRAIDPEETAAR